MIVSVFGSAAPLPGQPLYQVGLELGRLLGEQGFSVMTGGYCGTMEAVSRGANEAGSNVIGVTCRHGSATGSRTSTRFWPIPTGQPDR